MATQLVHDGYSGERRPFDQKKYQRAMSVNGTDELEAPWSLKKKTAILPLFLWNALVSNLFWNPLFKRAGQLATGIAWLKLRLGMITREDFRKVIMQKGDPRQWWSSPVFYRLAPMVVYLKQNATTWRAIEALYTMKDNPLMQVNGVFSKWLTGILTEVENIRATRNRCRLLKRRLWEEIDRLIELDEDRIVICSLAAGSLRAPIEVMRYFLEQDPSLINRIELHLVDVDPETELFARKLAKEACPGLEHCITYHNMAISGKGDGPAKLEALIRQINPNIVESVGFGDYLDDQKAVAVMTAINQGLQFGALFITNNVAPNWEQFFLEASVAWKMKNRVQAEVIRLMRAAGLQQVEMIAEPTAIQPIYHGRAVG